MALGVARTGQLLVRESEYGITDEVRIVLDNQVGDLRSAERFEAAVAVAASVAAFHLGAEMAVAIDTNDGELVSGLRGNSSRIRMLDALAGVEQGLAELTASLNRLLASRLTRGHHVVITSRLTDRAAKTLRVLLRSGRSVTLVLVVDVDTDPHTLALAGSMRCPVVEVASELPMSRSFEHAISRRRA